MWKTKRMKRKEKWVCRVPMRDRNLAKALAMATTCQVCRVPMRDRNLGALDIDTRALVDVCRVPMRDRNQIFFTNLWLSPRFVGYL